MSLKKKAWKRNKKPKTQTVNYLKMEGNTMKLTKTRPLIVLFAAFSCLSAFASEAPEKNSVNKSMWSSIICCLRAKPQYAIRSEVNTSAEIKGNREHSSSSKTLAQESTRIQEQTISDEMKKDVENERHWGIRHCFVTDLSPEEVAKKHGVDLKKREEGLRHIVSKAIKAFNELFRGTLNIKINDYNWRRELKGWYIDEALYSGHELFFDLSFVLKMANSPSLSFLTTKEEIFDCFLDSNLNADALKNFLENYCQNSDRQAVIEWAKKNNKTDLFNTALSIEINSLDFELDSLITDRWGYWRNRQSEQQEKLATATYYRKKFACEMSQEQKDEQLWRAYEFRHWKIIQFWLEQGANMSEDESWSSCGYTPFMRAAAKGKVQLCEALYAVGADPSIEFLGKNAFQLANEHAVKKGSKDFSLPTRILEMTVDYDKKRHALTKDVVKHSVTTDATIQNLIAGYAFGQEQEKKQLKKDKI